MALPLEPDRNLAPNLSKSGKFVKGIALFNAGEFFRAHELWEELWLASHGRDKLFLQGLVQSAAAFHHHSRGNLGGAASLLPASRAKLSEFPDIHWGIDLRDLRDRLSEWRTALAENPGTELIQTPRIRLRGE